MLLAILKLKVLKIAFSSVKKGLNYSDLIWSPNFGPSNSIFFFGLSGYQYSIGEKEFSVIRLWVKNWIISSSLPSCMRHLLNYV